MTSILLELLRDTYPLQYIFNVTVIPFQFGESPLQHYNMLLSLPYLQEYSDCALLLENDTVLNKAIQEKEKVITMSTLNSIMSDTLHNCINPNNK